MTTERRDGVDAAGRRPGAFYVDHRANGQQYQQRAREAVRSLPTFERILSSVFPAFAHRRAASRLALARTAMQLRAFDAADHGRRGAHWNARGSSANEESYSSLETLRARARDLNRNNSWANRALRALVTRVVGAGVRPQLDAMPEDVRAAWEGWANTTACSADDRKNVFGIQNIAVRSSFENGEVLLRRVITDDPLPLRIQVLEPDFIDSTKDGILEGGKRVIQGVQFDASGKREGYWLFREHPGDRYSTSSWRSDLIPAQDVAHVFVEERAGQVRGLPRGHSCFLRLRDWEQYVDAELMRKKNAAALVGFVRDIAVEAVPPSEDEPSDRVQEFEPGTWEYLPGGKQIDFSKPPATDGFLEFAIAMLRECSAAWGVTYEVMSGDYSQVTFTSGRMGWLEFDAEVEQLQRLLLIAQVMEPIWRWFAEAGTLASAFKARRPPPPTVWIPPRRKMLDPARELPARVTSVRNGFTTISGELLADGLDPEEALAQRQKDDKLLDRLGLVLDSDPRKIAAAGAAKGADAPPSADSEDSRPPRRRPATTPKEE